MVCCPKSTGVVLHKVFGYWYIRVPADSFEELDAAKALLEDHGFEVQYSRVVELFDNG